MPRDGSGVYSTPAGTTAVPDTTIESAKYNANVNDVAQDLNTPRPIVAGGTGATSAVIARQNLKAEACKQIVADYANTIFEAGSFSSVAGVNGAPVAGHAFSGICYLTDANNMFLEARDQDDASQPGRLYVRQMKAGVWSAWKIDFDAAALTTQFVDVAGDTMTGDLTLKGDPSTALMAAPKQYVDTAPNAVRYDVTQTLTAAQKLQACDNIGVQRKNYIINGGMVISQENGSTPGTTVNYYPVDQFFVNFANGGSCSVAQVASLTPSGSPNRLRYTVTAADASLAATDVAYIETRLEGYRVADLKAGTAAARTVTLQFGVKAPAGTYSVVLWNGAGNRSYISEYVITAGENNTDTIKSVTVTLDTAGTWARDNSAGLRVVWGLMAGLNFQGTVGVWGSVNAVGSSNQFNFMGTNGNVFELFDVSLTEGSIAPLFREVADPAASLTACQRYYNVFSSLMLSGYNGAGLAIYETYTYPTMRTAPSLGISNPTPSNVTSIAADAVNANNALIHAIMVASGGGTISFNMALNARM